MNEPNTVTGRVDTDKIIIRTMRFTLWGITILGALFLVYIIALVVASTRDNKRIDALELRVKQLETHVLESPNP